MFFSRKKCAARYLIYLSKILKYKNLIAKFQEGDSSKRVILIYFFESSAEDFIKLMMVVGLEVHKVSSQGMLQNGYNLIDARSAPSLNILDSDEVHILEIHPIYSLNQLPIKLAEKAGVKEVFYYSGLDESALTVFGSERLTKMMETLGLRDDEAIEHSMVTKSIERGQKKLEAKLGGHKDIQTSPGDWMQQNGLT